MKLYEITNLAADDAEDFLRLAGLWSFAKLTPNGYDINKDVSLTRSMDNWLERELPLQFNQAIGNFKCYSIVLKSFKGFPYDVHHDVTISDLSNFESFEGFPRIIGKDLTLNTVKSMSLAGIDEHLKELGGDLYLDPSKFKRGGLGLINIKGNFQVKNSQNASWEVSKPWQIINKHLAGDRDIFECQSELIENGYEAYTEL